MHLAAQVVELDELRQRAVPRRRDLGSPLAELRRDVAVAEEGVELVLGRMRDDLAGLDVGDAVLGDREPPALRVLPQRDVVVLRAREVLEHVAVALVRHDTQVEAEAVVAHDGRLRVAARDHLGDPVPVAERSDQRGRVARRRDEVEVADGLAPAPHASGLRDGSRRRVGRELGDDAPDRRKRVPEKTPGLRLVADPRLERLQDLLLAARAHPGQVAQPALLGGALQAVERGDPELRPDPRSRLRADAGEPQELDDTGGHEAAPLGERVHLAVLHDLDDLVLDRLADPGELLCAPVERELGNRQRRLPDPAGGAAVCDDLERLLLEDLGEVGEELELIRELAVAGQRLRHPAMILRCPERSSACPTYNERENLEAMIDALGAFSTRPPTACSSSTTALRTAQVRSPTGSPASARGCRCCTDRRRRGSARRTSPVSGGRSPRAPSSSSRWTATSRTTRRTSRG